MKFLIKFTFIRGTEIAAGEMQIVANDVRSALRIVESDLDCLGANVESVMPVEEIS